MTATVYTQSEMDQQLGPILVDIKDLKDRVGKLENTTTPPVPPTPTPTAKNGVYVPLFSYPTSQYWTQTINAKKAYPSVPFRVCINPSSGVGGSQNSVFVTGVNNLKAAGCEVCGYVYTSYAGRDPAACKAEIDKYKTWYNTDGIFFDEMSNVGGKEGYYTDLTNYVKSKGMKFTIGNPGTSTRPSFVGSVSTILIYETGGLPAVSDIKARCFNGQFPIDNFGIIPYAVGLDTTWINNIKPLCGWIYTTNDVLPNPWDTVPSYFDGLVKAIGGIA